MKLNPDCVRDILLTVEDEVNERCTIILSPKNFPRLQKYSEFEVYYHARQCDWCGFLYGAKDCYGEYFIVQDLTPAGHEFLANVRGESVWNKTKKTAATVGSYSLKALAQIAAGLVQAAIARELGVNP